MTWLADPQIWIAFVTLLALEIVLGIDNVIFLAILAGKLPRAQQQRGRIVGLAMAMLTRIALLFSLSWMVRLTAPLFTIASHEFSGRDLILILGGLFLLIKSAQEIRQEFGEDEAAAAHATNAGKVSFTAIIVQIALLDIVFSLDSVITAVGMVEQIEIMLAAILCAVAFMMLASGFFSDFIERHPTIKILALSFLLLIGTSLVVEGFDGHIPKGYIYFAMGFSVFVEALNLKMRHKQTPSNELHESSQPDLHSKPPKVKGATISTEAH
ncbi:MAG: TerC family protein [Abitibacteriaceae bacterium]|nr:TerC family protein [Abditibacteriaceae bacterium]